MVKLKVRKGKSKKKSKIKTNKISRRKSRRKSKIKISRRKSRRKSKKISRRKSKKISRRKSRRTSKIKISRRKSKIKIYRRKSRRKSKKKTVSVNKKMLGGEWSAEDTVYYDSLAGLTAEAVKKKKKEEARQRQLPPPAAVKLERKHLEKRRQQFEKQRPPTAIEEARAEYDNIEEGRRALRDKEREEREKKEEYKFQKSINVQKAINIILEIMFRNSRQTLDQLELTVYDEINAAIARATGGTDDTDDTDDNVLAELQREEEEHENKMTVTNENKVLVMQSPLPDSWAGLNPRMWDIYEAAVDFYKTIKEVKYLIAEEEEEATAPHKRRIVVEPYPHYKKEAQAIKKLIEDSLCGNDDHPWNWNHEMSGINNLIKKAKRLFSGFKPVHDWKKINTLEKKAWLEHHGPRGHKTLEDAGWEQTGEGWWSRWEQTGEGWKNLHTGKVRPLDFRSDPPGLGEDVDVIVRHLKTTTEDHLSKVKDKWVPMNSAERLLRRDGFYGRARGNQCRDHSTQYHRRRVDNEVRLDELSLCIKEELWNYYWQKMLLTHTENKEDYDDWWTTHWKNEQEIAAAKWSEFGRLDESTVMNKQQFVVLWNTEMARDALGPGIKAKNTEMRTKLSKLIQKSLLNEYPHHQKNKEDKKYWTDYWVKYWEPDQVKWENELLQRHQEHILVMREKMEELSWEYPDYIPSQKKQLKELKKSVNKGREKIEKKKREDKRERWVTMLARLGQSSSGAQRPHAAVEEEAQSTFEPAEPPMSSSLLPPGWEKLVDPSSGKHYYQHVASHTSSWTVPTHEPASPSSGSKPNTTAGDMVQSSAPQRSAAELAKIKNLILNMKRPALEAELTKRGIQLESFKCTHTKRRCSKSFLKNLVIKNLDKTSVEVDDDDAMDVDL